MKQLQGPAYFNILVVLSREYGNASYRYYVGILFPHSLPRTGKEVSETNWKDHNIWQLTGLMWGLVFSPFGEII